MHRGCWDPTWFGRKSLALLSQEPRAAGHGWPESATNSLGSVGIVTQHSLEPGLENTPWLPQTRSERHSQGL